MRVQLIHPPAYVNPTALTALAPSLPLGLAYIASSTRAAGHEVSVIDAVGEAPGRIVREGKVAALGLSAEEIVARIEPETQVVGLSQMFTYQWYVVKRILAAIKEARPDVLIVSGGEHFTGQPAYALDDSETDLVVIGEGEETFVDVLRRYDEFLAGRNGNPDEARAHVGEWLAGCAGTGYRDAEGRAVLEERRARVRDVDSIPPPAWDLFDVLTYDESRWVTGIRKGITVPLFATRGCPYQCTYCSSPNMWTTRWVARDPKLVADEMQDAVERYGATSFPFHDLTAILKRQWIIDFCNEIIERGLDVSWQLPSGTRCEVVDDEVAALFKRSGGWSLNFAPESGSERVRKKVKKRMTEESLMNAVQAATRHGLNLTVFFVLGFPGDEDQDMRDTVKMAKRLAKAGVDDLAVGFFFPIPGTFLWDQLEKEGRVSMNEDTILAPLFVHDRWMTEEHNFSGSMSARQLTMWKYRIVFAFYLRAVLLNPKRWWRLLSNLLRGREDSKLDSFMAILRQRLFPRMSARASADVRNGEASSRPAAH